MTTLESLAALATFLNTGIITAIYFKLGSHDEKHKNHEKRLNNLEGILSCGNALKSRQR